MAQFRASMQGQRGEASRLGGKSSGISARVNGWRLGIDVDGRYDEKTDSDVFTVAITQGSSYRGIATDYVIKETRNEAGQLIGFVVREKPAEIADGA